MIFISLPTSLRKHRTIFENIAMGRAWKYCLIAEIASRWQLQKAVQTVTYKETLTAFCNGLENSVLNQRIPDISETCKPNSIIKTFSKFHSFCASQMRCELSVAIMPRCSCRTLNLKHIDVFDPDLEMIHSASHQTDPLESCTVLLLVEVFAMFVYIVL